MANEIQSMPLSMLVTFSEVDPENEREFGEWYETHLAEFVSCPGIDSASRFLCENGPFHGVALYELTRDDALETPEVKSYWGWGPFENQVKNVDAGVYRRIVSLRKS